MDAWLTLVLGILVPTTGGGVWVTARQWMAWRERRERAQRDHETALETERKERARAYREHETALAARIESMQERFSLALREANDRADRHRNEHLDDVKLYSQRLSEVIQAFRDRTSSRPSSQSTTQTGATSPPK